MGFLIKSIYWPQVANWRSVPKSESMHTLLNALLWKNCLVKHKECSLAYPIYYQLLELSKIFKPHVLCSVFNSQYFDHCCFFSKLTNNAFISKQKHASLGKKYGWNKRSKIIVSCFLIFSFNRMAE